MCLTKYFKQYFIHYLLGLISIVVVDIIQLKVPEITGNITDDLQKGIMTQSNLLGYIQSLIFVGVMIVLLRFLWRYFIFGTSRKIEYGLRNDFFSHLETLSAHFYHKNKTGDLMAYATNDLGAIRMMVGPGVLMLLDAVVMTIIVVARMIESTTLLLTLLAIIPMPIIALNSLFLGKVIEKRFDEKQQAFAKLSDIVQENISGIRVIKAFVQEAYEIMHFGKVNKDNYEKNMKVVRVHSLMFPLAMLVTGISIAIALGYGGQLAMVGTITLGKFVAFIQYIMMLIWPMIAFGWFINIMSQGKASLKRFQEILDIQPEIIDHSDSESITTIQGDIQFNQLNFTYPESQTHVLSEISLHIQQGQTIGIVGRTGCGKTTLVNLLLRLFDYTDGSILVDGKSIQEWPLKELRSAIGYVPQDTFLFSDSISHNISFGLESSDAKAIQEAAENVDVHENIIEFEEGYSTVIGERGVTLSGGQKQRISIARALIKDPAILILDDAVSAVDTKTEEKILGHLREVRRGKTTIMIAHRISTIQDSDVIVVIEEGRILEIGNHTELVEQGGLYASMVQMQQLEKSIQEVE